VRSETAQEHSSRHFKNGNGFYFFKVTDTVDRYKSSNLKGQLHEIFYLRFFLKGQYHEIFCLFSSLIPCYWGRRLMHPSPAATKFGAGDHSPLKACQPKSFYPRMKNISLLHSEGPPLSNATSPRGVAFTKRKILT
jgi:hypothetical protein